MRNGCAHAPETEAHDGSKNARPNGDDCDLRSPPTSESHHHEQSARVKPESLEEGSGSAQSRPPESTKQLLTTMSREQQPEDRSRD